MKTRTLTFTERTFNVYRRNELQSKISKNIKYFRNIDADASAAIVLCSVLR